MSDPINQATVIGPDTFVKGELTFESTARILGRVEGKISSRGEVQIGEGAACRAAVEGDRVVIDGTVEGDVSARDRVELNAKAKLTGDITANTLVVTEGACYTGYCRVGPEAAALPKPARTTTGVANAITNPAGTPTSQPATTRPTTMTANGNGHHPATTPVAAPVNTPADGLAAAFAGLEAKLAGIGRARTADAASE